MGVFLRALKYGLSGSAGAVLASEYASASGDQVTPSWIKWPHNGLTATLDYAAVRRGFSVYKQVCSACHSMQFLEFKQLVGVTHTEAEVKEMAAEYEIQNDEPNGEGEYFMRPRGLLDNFPAPYTDAINARLANNGALPPDLSLIVYGRTHGLDGLYGEDYIFHLLTGYMDPPAGVSLAEGMHYNPYFTGGAIGMAAPLYNEIIQYDDGTPATMSQLAADVIQFLAWSTDKHADERKEKCTKGLMWSIILVPLLITMKHNDFAGVKSIYIGMRGKGQRATKAYTGKPFKA